MKVWHLTEQQQALLRNYLEDLGQKLLSVTFNDPKDDEATIRQHAFFKGQLDFAAQMLRDDYPPPQQVNDADVQSSQSIQ